MLPGGDLSAWIERSGRPDVDIVRFEQALAARHPQLDAAMRHRWAHSYGSLVEHILSAATLGAEVAPGLYEAELNYLREHEWARSAEDVLWRRTKLGLHLSAQQRANVERWWHSNAAPAGATTQERAWN
jgi:glycerol-3-phosphate dehydrogenase